jgi:hypothetical protein
MEITEGAECLNVFFEKRPQMDGLVALDSVTRTVGQPVSRLRERVCVCVCVCVCARARARARRNALHIIYLTIYLLPIFMELFKSIAVK